MEPPLSYGNVLFRQMFVFAVDGLSVETLQAVGGFPLTADIFCTWYDVYANKTKYTIWKHAWQCAAIASFTWVKPIDYPRLPTCSRR